VVVIADATLLDGVNVTDGAREDAVFIVNTAKEPAELRQRLGLNAGQKVCTVDATKIAIDCFGRAMPNSPLLGAVCRATGVVTIEALLDDVGRSFGKKFSRKIIDGNLDAAKRGYQEVRQG
jgi:pyruvate ferredoxin oxidoreductase gamma subunit